MIQFKVILVKGTTQELEKQLNAGWRTVNAYSNPAGTLIILGKEKASK